MTVVWASRKRLDPRRLHGVTEAFLKSCIEDDKLNTLARGKSSTPCWFPEARTDCMNDVRALY